MPHALSCLAGVCLALLAPAAAAGEEPAPSVPSVPIWAPPASDWELSFDGYLHAAYRWIQQPQNYSLAGRNNGFQLEQARLVASVSWRRWLSLRVSFEGASEDRLGQSFPGGQITARLRDAYLTFSPLRALRLTVGQMVTPWDLDSMRSDAELPFVSRAVPVEGVQPTEGYATRGMGTDRSLGIELHSDFLGLPAAFSLRYAAFVGNGNGQNQLLSDNNLPAVFGRVELAYWGRRPLPPARPGPMYAVADLPVHPVLNVGLAGQWTPRTRGNLPDLVHETESGVAADLLLSLFGIDVQAGVLYLRTSYDTLKAVPDLERLGYWAHAQYTIPRIPPVISLGYRIAGYSPRAHLQGSAATPADAQFDGSLDLLYHTVGVTVRPLRSLPVHAALNYTITVEQPPNTLDNDRFEVDVVAVF